MPSALEEGEDLASVLALLLIIRRSHKDPKVERVKSLVGSRRKSGTHRALARSRRKRMTTMSEGP